MIKLDGVYLKLKAENRGHAATLAVKELESCGLVIPHTMPAQARVNEAGIGHFKRYEVVDDPTGHIARFVKEDSKPDAPYDIRKNYDEHGRPIPPGDEGQDAKPVDEKAMRAYCVLKDGEIFRVSAEKHEWNPDNRTVGLYVGPQLVSVFCDASWWIDG